jgi:hypothetical protein
MRTLGWSLCSLSLVLTACPGDDAPTGDDATQGSTADDTGPPPATSTTEPTTSVTSTGPDQDTGSSSGTATGTDSGSSAGSETGPASCDFETILCEHAAGKTEPVDCGTVTLDDDAAAWQAASLCAVENANMQAAFKVAFELPSIDSIVYDGYFGSVGFAYALGRVYSDTLGDPVLGVQSCIDVVAMADCLADVGDHCLECVGAGQIMPIECAMQ